MVRSVACGIALAAALVTGCSAEADAVQAGEGVLIECALGGEAAFAKACAVERIVEGSTPVLTVRHPDGGFRRFEVMPDGSGLAAADGADAARSTLSGGAFEVAVGPDRYRFPAAMAGVENADGPGT